MKCQAESQAREQAERQAQAETQKRTLLETEYRERLEAYADQVMQMEARFEAGRTARVQAEEKLGSYVTALQEAQMKCQAESQAREQAERQAKAETQKRTLLETESKERFEAYADQITQMQARFEAERRARVQAERKATACAEVVAELKVRAKYEAPVTETPQAALPPRQVNRLIDLHWDDPDYPIKFNQQLKMSDLRHSTFLANATIFLQTLLELEDQYTATAKRNLNRKFVKAIFDKLINDDIKKDILRFNKVIHEKDVLLLNVVRIVCQEARLIQCRKKKFIVTTKGKKLLSKENTGELFYRLFITYFRKFNIGYVDRLPDLDSVQHAIGYSLCRLSVVCHNYRTLEQLFHEIFLPKVRQEIRDEIRKERVNIREIGRLMELRMIRPLVGFGLINCKLKKEKYIGRVVAIRKSPLFDKFIKA
jgi:hypothetical protein